MKLRELLDITSKTVITLEILGGETLTFLFKNNNDYAFKGINFIEPYAYQLVRELSKDLKDKIIECLDCIVVKQKIIYETFLEIPILIITIQDIQK